MPSFRLSIFGLVFAGVVVLTVQEQSIAAPSWQDPAFDSLVPPALIRQALSTLAPDQLVTLAEKLADAEMKLKRAHKGLPFSAVTRMAFRAATSKRDTASLDRLAKLAQGIGDNELYQQARLARSASRGPRSGDSLSLPLDRLPPEEFAVIRGLMSQINSARTTEDREALERLQKRIAAVDTDERIRAHLTKNVREALASLPMKANPEMALVQAAKAEVDDAVVKAETPMKEDPKEEPSEKPKINPPKNLAEVVKILTEHGVEALNDEGFEGRIDLMKIGKAFGKPDPAGLTDQAFRMAAEERTINRPHQFVPAEMLFKGSMGLAMMLNDQKTLDRIEGALKGNPAQEETLVKMVASRKLTSGSRKGNKPLMASLEDVSEESFFLFRYCLDEVEVAKRGQDVSILTALEIGLPEMTALNTAQRAHLTSLILETKRSLPEKPDETLAALNLLATVATRETMVSSLSTRLLSFARLNLSKHVGDPKQEAFLRAGLASIGAKLPATDDGTWGRKIVAVQVQPGDIIRLSSNESAVVSKTLIPGRSWAVFVQRAPKTGGPAVVVLADHHVTPGTSEPIFFRPTAK